MHMTRGNKEAAVQYSVWSACLAVVTVFAIADAATGGLLRESVLRNSTEYAVMTALMIATVGVYASDGSPGHRFVRAYSRHKL